MSQHPFQNFMIRFRAGEPIFLEGDPGTTMFVVQSGRVGLFRELEGDKRAIGTLEKGDFFGEMSILEGMPRTMSAEAVEDAELVEINSMIFDKMIRGNIEIAVRMLRKLSMRLRATEVRLSEIDPSGPRSTTAAAVQGTSQKPSDAATGVRLEIGDSCFLLEQDETLVGRYDPVTELKPDIDLTDLDLKRSVSRRHAKITRTAEGFFFQEEVGALNGTFLNDEQLAAGQPHAIADGDRLGVGSVAMTFRT